MTTTTASPGALQPQDWYEVGSPPARLARAAGAVAAQYGTGVLGPDELRELVARLATQTALWEPLLVCDAVRRRYRLLFEDPRLDIWVLSWMPGQATGYHDHGVSAVALTALQGSVLEQQIRLTGRDVRRELRPGTVRSGQAGYIHSVRHLAGEPAATLHAYSPPLLEVGQYRAGPAGELVRESQHGRQELLDHTLRHE